MADQDVIYHTVDPCDQTTRKISDIATDLGGSQNDTLPSSNDADTLLAHHNISSDIASCIKTDTRFNALDFGLTTTSAAPQNALICFAYGTHIMTDRGDRPVQTLNMGDKVITRDHGMQKIRWIGSRKVAAIGDTAPIIFKKGTINNTRDLVVSPRHRMLFTGDQAELMFGQSEVLVAAKYLLHNDGVYQVVDGFVEYFHILFDRHEIIYAEGTATESYHPGDDNLDAISARSRDEIFNIFPELRSLTNSYGPTSRTCLKAHEGQLLTF